MVKILVIQLDRFGDTLWITPFLAGLAQAKAPCQISVLVRPEVAEALEGNPHIHEIITADWLDIGRTWPGMMVKGSELLSHYRRLSKVIANLRARNFDYVYNMNFKKMTTILTYLINSPQTIGFTLSRDGARLIKGAWVNYLGCLVTSREYNLFNMVDIFRRFEPALPSVHDLVFKVSPEERSAADDTLSGFGVKDGDFLIGFQPGASTTKRIWPAAYFAELGDMLAGNFGARIVLFGVEGERYLGEEIERRMQNPAINLIGKTTIPRLAAFLERCRCLVSNDTGPMHLAAAVGTKTIGLFFSHAHFAETAPYGEDHIVFQPNIPCAPCSWKSDCPEGNPCLHYVTPEVVFGVMEKWLGSDETHIRLRRTKDNENNPPKSPFDKGGDPSIPPLEKGDTGGFSGGTLLQLDDSEDLAKVNIYRAFFDVFDFLTYFPVIKRPAGIDDILRIAYKLMWISTFDGEPGKWVMLDPPKSHLSPRRAGGDKGEGGRPHPSPLPSRERGALGTSSEAGKLDYVRAHLSYYDLANSLDGLSKEIDGCVSAITTLQGLFKDGWEATRKLQEVIVSQPVDQARLSETMVSLDKVDAAIEDKGANPFLRPLAMAFSLDKQNLEGTNIYQLAGATASIYEQAERRAQGLIHYLREIQTAWKTGESNETTEGTERRLLYSLTS
ncbi:MAG: glycosyltransferase family 9 protein [Thermodesulfobacteriota bacterium]